MASIKFSSGKVAALMFLAANPFLLANGSPRRSGCREKLQERRGKVKRGGGGIFFCLVHLLQLILILKKKKKNCIAVMKKKPCIVGPKKGRKKKDINSDHLQFFSFLHSFLIDVVRLHSPPILTYWRAENKEHCIANKNFGIDNISQYTINTPYPFDRRAVMYLIQVYSFRYYYFRQKVLLRKHPRRILSLRLLQMQARIRNSRSCPIHFLLKQQWWTNMLFS